MRKKRKNSKTNLKKWLGILFVGSQLMVIALVTLNLPKVQDWLSDASSGPAQVVVDTQSILGPLPVPWKNLAQGGEAPEYRLSAIQDKVALLQPEYIRIDHVFDFYKVVNRTTTGELSYNWKHLDALLGDIQKVGAKPFISLSYTPTTLGDGSLVDKPQSWTDWQELIQATIEHISGTGNGQLGLEQVYYEVWNEPDLFGNWKVYGDKNYLELYRNTAIAAQRAQPVSNQFYLGGPATTKLYPNWIEGLAQLAINENLPLDFISWHRYDLNPDSYRNDGRQTREILEKYPSLSAVQLIISEWGINSDLDPAYDTQRAAAHFVSSTISSLGSIDRLFAFEIEDGLSPNQQAFWGRWGVLTHRSFGAQEKPRYIAFKLLSELGKERVTVSSNKSYVSALAAKRTTDMLTETLAVELVVSQYHKSGKGASINLPIVFKNLVPGSYRIQETHLSNTSRESGVATTTTQLIYLVSLSQNDVVLVKIEKIE